MRTIHPSIVGTMLTPKADELVANPYRHDGKQGAEKFFIEGFNSVFHRIREDDANPDVPMTVYYAYKQPSSWPVGPAPLMRGPWRAGPSWLR